MDSSPVTAVVVDTADRADAASPSGLRVDSDRRVLRWRDQEIELTRLEHDLLLCLVGAPGRVWTYERLHQTVWGNEHLGRGSDMHSVVRRVRRKLVELGASATIHAVRGVGFRLAPA
ncbi:winged helix-turn-helix domain-containing protein [Micromonospora krabiensis]|uniref:winged helix-turn-helix domain-containing protein n=1 Tax=Micromonospora krabiensis TaxID=307121 RepID=UPI001E581F89|nr:winged helix-turn-helix domain-containing protein [Micromonospora krabiensis]